MMRFFIDGVKGNNLDGYGSYKGVLTAYSYDPCAFHSNLLIGFNSENKVKNISFSFCAYGKNKNEVENSTFALIFDEKSQINVTFFSPRSIYSLGSEQDGEKIIKLQAAITQLKDRRSSSRGNDPRMLLIGLFNCITEHEKIIKNSHKNTREDFDNKFLPMFLDSLTYEFNEETNRLGVNVNKECNP